MEERLYGAAVAGNIRTLNQLLQEDPLFLDKATTKCSDKTPLHIAALLGHVDFVRAILSVSSDMCLGRDRDGRNPLHLAAIKGKRDVLELLIQSRPLAAREKTDGGGTVLHLCVKYNQLEALKMLVENVKDPGFLNTKNDEGMTILHLAVLDKQIETIQFLVENRIDINAKNANGKTALDIFPGDVNSDIGTFLQKSRALRAEEIAVSPTGHDRPTNGSEWLAKKRDAIMVVASLIATMAFQATVNPPGGFWQDDKLTQSQGEPVPPHQPGEAVVASIYPDLYKYLLQTNTIAFVSSLSTILLLISGLPFRNRVFMWFLMVVMWLTITTIALSYRFSAEILTPEDNLESLSHVIRVAVIVWLSVMSVLLLGNTIRLINRWLKGCGINILGPKRSGKSALQDHSKDKEVALQIQE